MPQPSMRGARRSVAMVIASRAMGARTAKVLVAEGLEVEPFASAEDLEEGAPGRSVALVLLCVDGGCVAVAGAVAQLARRFEQTPLVLVCASVRPRDLRAALAAGACGVVLRDDLRLAL